MSSAKQQNVETNLRGIPKSPFVERVEEYVTDVEPVEVVLKKFQEAISKYKFMEINMLQRKKVLEEKMPEIKKTLSIVEFLISRRESKSDEPIITEFELNDTLYAKAKVENTGTVFLWLGANVMLEYTLEEARELLASKLAAALRSLTNAEEDLEFLRDQITTMEVNTARVFNWDVKQRRTAKAKAG